MDRFLLILIVLVCFRHAISISMGRVEYLPGFQAPLPFHLETGYLGVDKNEDVQLFYYFIQSESDPKNDPILLWLTGGPGCSSISGLLFEIGPIEFVELHYNGSLPSLILSPTSWTKVANIIFLDIPVGTGFSYARTTRAAHSTNIQYVDHAYEFMRKWLNSHPEFISNPFYVGGGSYSGIPVPMITQLILEGNEVGTEPYINLEGYVLGNPKTFPNESNFEIQFAKGMGLVSDELYKDEVTSLTEYWANDPSVREALHIQKGSIGDWVRCSSNLSFTKTLDDVRAYHLNLSKKGCRSLIFSGDHDMVVPHQSTQAWIKDLNYSFIDQWRSWKFHGQIAGYTESYSNMMTYATIKGGGHTAAESNPDECFAMFKRWISYQPL